MTEYQRTPRRGRPPKAAVEDVEQPQESTETGKPRRRRKKVGEAALKLKAPQREGYVRRFAMAKPERVAELEDLGYTVVSDSSIPSTGFGATVQRPAGAGEDGTYYRHILMETPTELYAEGRDELEAHNAKVDESIRRGRDKSGRLSAAESYGEGSIEVERGAG